MPVRLSLAALLVSCGAACTLTLDDDDAALARDADEQAVEPVCGAPSQVCPSPAVVCADLAETLTYRWSARADDGSLATRTVVTTPVDVVRGARAVRLVTASGGMAWLRYQASSLRPIDAQGATALELVVRGTNANAPTWQGHAPVVALVDTLGRRRVLTPDRGLLSSDGATWTRVSVPLGGGPSARGDASFTKTGDVDLARLRSIEIGADTWGAGFSIDVDGIAFVDGATATAGCAVDCPARCSDQGTCDQDTAACACDVGTTGAGCAACRPGFVDDGARCALPSDASFDVWPNDASRANSDPWLAVHHDEIQTLKPKVLVLDFVNPGTPAATVALVDSVISAFAEASRPKGGGAPALQYELARSIVDLRDGVAGRPAAPAGYPYENSTLTPRRAAPDGTPLTVDYKAFFSPAFASLYGWVDTATNTPADLCTLVNTGLVHEVWVVVSGDVPDSGFAETLEMKPRYDAAGNQLDGPPSRCAGNGCFEEDVPFCGRTIRILAINHARGTGCALHSFGHGVEGMGTRDIVPGLQAWFRGYAGFDLQERYGVPYGNLYELGCEDDDGDGVADRTCLEYPLQDAAVLHDRGTTTTVHPYDARCGNVHFPPNATWHYEYGSAARVSSSCAAYGRGGAAVAVDAAAWSGLEALAPDCGGGFLIWWLRNMPRAGSGQTFADGAPMRPIWPYLFY